MLNATAVSPIQPKPLKLDIPFKSVQFLTPPKKLTAVSPFSNTPALIQTEHRFYRCVIHYPTVVQNKTLPLAQTWFPVSLAKNGDLQLQNLIYIIIWLSLLVLFVRISLTAKPACLDPQIFAGRSQIGCGISKYKKNRNFKIRTF
jgi:hypothetical protein